MTINPKIRVFDRHKIGLYLGPALFALVLIFAAGLSVFIALYNALNERRYDLAVMRTLARG